jgi:hypothetical protein
MKRVEWWCRCAQAIRDAHQFEGPSLKEDRSGEGTVPK